MDAPLGEQVGSEGQRRIAPAVIAVVVVCALLAGLAALAATLGGATANPHPAASIAPRGTTAPAARARTGVSRAGIKHIGGHGHSGHGSATPLHATTRSVVRKPTATPARRVAPAAVLLAVSTTGNPNEQHSLDTIDTLSAMVGGNELTRA